MSGLIFEEIVTLKKAKESLEKRLLKQALEQFGTTRKAAAALGVAQPTIVRKAQKYGFRLRD